MVCEVRNDLQDGPHPKAIEYVLSEILVPVQNFQEMRSGKKWLQNVKSTLKILWTIKFNVSKNQALYRPKHNSRNQRVCNNLHPTVLDCCGCKEYKDSEL